PEYWKLYYREGNEWIEVSNPSGYGVEEDRYNHVTFDPVTTDQLKLVARLQGPDPSWKPNSDNRMQASNKGKNGYSAGVIEWKVNE
nr:glycoside hydrolase family 127 protein [Proteiniphilum sp.]